MRLRACAHIAAVAIPIALGVAQGERAAIEYTQYHGGNVAELQSSVEFFANMPDEQLIGLVPTQNGFYFTQCPDCDGGHEGHSLTWDPARPSEVRCIRCGHVYPSEKYPVSGVAEVVSPAGNRLQYPYWADGQGYRYYLASFRDFEARRRLSHAAYAMAYIYHVTRNADYARRSALILNRFAEVYGDYVYKLDLPFGQKTLYDGAVAPADFRPGFETSRWDRSAYLDIPLELVLAYDLIGTSGELDRIEGARERIVDEFLLQAADQVAANQDPLSSMSPVAWQGMIAVGRILAQPEFVHTVVERLQRLMRERFYYDGAWRDGAPSCHAEVLSGLNEAFRLARGYSDPPEYKHPATGLRIDELDLERDVAGLARTFAALDAMRLPDGRLSPVHDSWATACRGALETSGPALLPALGHAVLGRGHGDGQMQVHLTWSGAHGNHHFDGLSMHLFAEGEQMLPDIGRTHTRYRGWALATASHNTVVVDFENQHAGCTPPSEGALQLFDVLDPDFQIAMVDNPQVYPKTVDVYTRLMVLVGIDDDAAYVVDGFNVKGGEQHDYFLHGSADAPQTLRLVGPTGPLDGEPVETMLPEDFPEWVAPRGEQHASRITQRGYAYGFLQQSSVINLAGGIVTADFAYAEKDMITRTHLVTRDHDQLYFGRNPGVRPVGNDGDEPATLLRPYIMLGRFPGPDGSLFCSIIEPRGSGAGIRAVETIATQGYGCAVAVTCDGFTDVIGLYADGLTGTVLGREFSMTGPVCRLRIADDDVLAANSTGQLTWGDFSLQSDTKTAKLTGTMAGATGGALTIDADWTAPAPPQGTVLIVDHGDGFTHGYTVVSTAKMAAGSLIAVEQEPGFELDPAAGVATFRTFPQRVHAGEHTVLWPAVAIFRK